MWSIKSKLQNMLTFYVLNLRVFVVKMGVCINMVILREAFLATELGDLRVLDEGFLGNAAK